MDAWDFLRIFIYKKEEITMYDFRFIESFGQPISINKVEILDKKKNTVNIIGNKELQVINLNANLLLQQIVPKKSLTNNILDLNNIRNEYIIWFLKEGRF